jgi:hypothetical protein
MQASIPIVKFLTWRAFLLPVVQDIVSIFCIANQAKSLLLVSLFLNLFWWFNPRTVNSLLTYA